MTPDTETPSPHASQLPIPPGKPEEPVPTLVGRWMLLGCAATAAVLLVAFMAMGAVVIWGVSK